MEELKLIAILTYFSFATAIFVVLILTIIDIISEWVNKLIAKHKVKKLDKYIKDNPNTDLAKNIQRFNEAVEKFVIAYKNAINDDIDCMGK